MWRIEKMVRWHKIIKDISQSSQMYFRWLHVYTGNAVLMLSLAGESNTFWYSWHDKNEGNRRGDKLKQSNSVHWEIIRSIDVALA